MRIVDCEECNGFGMSGGGTGYDSVCDKCGGKGRHPEGNSIPTPIKPEVKSTIETQ